MAWSWLPGHGLVWVLLRCTVRANPPWPCPATAPRSQLLGKLLADLASMREESVQTAGLQHADSSAQYDVVSDFRNLAAGSSAPAAAAPSGGGDGGDGGGSTAGGTAAATAEPSAASARGTDGEEAAAAAGRSTGDEVVGTGGLRRVGVGQDGAAAGRGQLPLRCHHATSGSKQAGTLCCRRRAGARACSVEEDFPQFTALSPSAHSSAQCVAPQLSSPSEPSSHATLHPPRPPPRPIAPAAAAPPGLPTSSPTRFAHSTAPLPLSGWKPRIDTLPLLPPHRAGRRRG